MVILSTNIRHPEHRNDVLVWEATYGHWHVAMWDGGRWVIAAPVGGENFTHWCELPAEPKPGFLAYAEHQEPPYDGRPCPMCPTAIRNLAAVAHNLVSQLDRRASECKIAETVNSLRGAVKMVEPYSQAHFADRFHSHGERP